jgi:5-(carboxyamino)imidazole ribonucleotide mutase
MPKVAVVMGSKSDAPVMQATLDTLQSLGIEYDVQVISAHRTPEKARRFGRSALDNGFEVIIAAAGYAAHLPGVMASWTTLPVIGVPLSVNELKGADALFSMSQMPGGIPVATVAIGEAGAKNAAFLAAEILGLKYDEIKQAYDEYRLKFADTPGENK